MKFFAVASLLVASVAALPSMPIDSNNDAVGNGAGNVGNSNVRFPVQKETTVQQAQAKCGNNTTLKCCNKASYTGGKATAQSGLVSNALSGLIGSGSDSGLGLFDQCSELSLTADLGLDDLVNKKCNQNVACCQNSPSNASGGLINVAVPCVALGSLV